MSIYIKKKECLNVISLWVKTRSFELFLFFFFKKTHSAGVELLCFVKICEVFASYSLFIRSVSVA